LKSNKGGDIHDGSFMPSNSRRLCRNLQEAWAAIITSQEAIAPTDTDMRPVLTKIATGKPEFNLLSYFCRRWRTHHPPGEGV